MNILTAVRQITFVGKLFAAAKLDLNAMIDTGDETALAAHLATISAPAAITADHPEVAALITSAVTAAAATLNSQLSALNSQLAATSTALETAGVKLTAKPADEGYGAALTAAINARASILAQQELSKRGLAQFPGSEPAADPTKPAAKASNLTGLARTIAAFAAAK